MKYILWWPGYLILTIGYFFPGEWGRDRSVSKSYRRWQYRDTIAPIISVMCYLPVWFIFISAIVK